MTIGVGILVAFAGNSFVFELHNGYTKDLFFNGNKFPPEVLKLKNWLFGIIGGTIVGFHFLMIMISENSFKKKETWAYKAMWLGLLSWFCIDSCISIYYGAIHNVIIINLVALIIIGPAVNNDEEGICKTIMPTHIKMWTRLFWACLNGLRKIMALLNMCAASRIKGSSATHC